MREDYSADGDAWESFPFEHSHARAYRWKDPLLKERLYGLTNGQGNHGEVWGRTGITE